MAVKAMLTMVGLGALFALILAIANQRLKVEEDPRVEELAGKLPGLNCGACGFPSCHEFAKTVVSGGKIETMCRMASPEARELISRITGVKKEAVKRVACVFCGASSREKTSNARYEGIETCRAADIISGAGMNCAYGCIGYGDCAKACPFGGIEMKDGLPRIDPDRCIACGKCVEACPRDIIGLIPYEPKNVVIPACRSKDAGGRVRSICAVGCIGCRICEKLSGGVFRVEDNLARIDTSRMTEEIDWDRIIEKCPAGTIVRLR